MQRRFATPLVAATLAAVSLSSALAPALGAQSTDSTQTKHKGKPFFVPKDLVVLGSAAVVSVGVMPFDKRVAHWWQEPAQQNNSTLSSIGNHWSGVQETTLTLGSFGVYLIARVSHANELADIAFHSTEGVVLASIVSQAIRGPLGRARPDWAGDTAVYQFHAMGGFTNFKYRSYPSLHAASNFAVASVLTAETKERGGPVWIVAPVAYVLASLPPTARMYLNRHWASDVVMGAAVGTWAGWKIVDYSHDHPVTPTDRFFLGVRDHLHLEATPYGTGFGYQASF